MVLDADAERALEMVRASGRPPYETLSPAEARALFLAGREVLALQWFYDCYLRGAADVENWCASPLRAAHSRACRQPWS